MADNLSAGLTAIYLDCTLSVNETDVQEVYMFISDKIRQCRDVATCLLVGSTAVGLALGGCDIDIFVAGGYLETSNARRHKMPFLLAHLKRWLNKPKKKWRCIAINASVPILKFPRFHFKGRTYSVDITCCDNCLYNLMLIKGM